MLESPSLQLEAEDGSEASVRVLSAGVATLSKESTFMEPFKVLVEQRIPLLLTRAASCELSFLFVIPSLVVPNSTTHSQISLIKFVTENSGFITLYVVMQLSSTSFRTTCKSGTRKSCPFRP
uniref:Uncharacterized protein n=1 Tax=Opuntia streptacantha TaxID=393608 RepID=A0A7C8YWJ1_OPUST